MKHLKTYFINYDRQFSEFLKSKGIKEVTGDADITAIDLEEVSGYMSDTFFELAVEFGKWLKENKA